MRVSVAPACTVALIVLLSWAPVAAQDAAVAGRVGEIPLPGGIKAALAALDDPLPPDRAQFLLEVVRRAYGTTDAPGTDPGVQRLFAALERAAPEASGETLPLPLSPEIWTKLVFTGATPASGLPLAIMRSRDAARLYCALLSLDDETRAWLTTEPRLLAELASDKSAPFLLAAPGLRIHATKVRLPGGEAAVASWEAIAGARVTDPAAFVRALLVADGGIVAYMAGVASELTPAQAQFLLGADAPDPARRVDRAKHMAAVFRRAAGDSTAERWAFWRPTVDPASIVEELPVDARGRPTVPGSQGFWEAVLRGGTDRRADSAPVDIAWLCERVFENDSIDRREISNAILFAARRLPAGIPAGEDAIVAVRGALRFPALALALERAGVDDLAVYTAAVRRAERLSSLGSGPAALRAITEFQGVLALLIQATLHGSIPRATFPGLVMSLCAVDVNEHGEFDGRLVRWMNTNLSQDVLPLLAGRGPTPTVEWEGTRYRLDFAAAESARLFRLLDDNQFPAFTSARTLVNVADDLRRASLPRERVHEHVAALSALAPGLPAVDRQRVQDAVRQLEKSAKSRTTSDAARVAPSLVAVADEAFARGLRHLAYAAVFRQPEADPSLVWDVAARHEFGPTPDPAALAWRLPKAGGDPVLGWHVAGSLLELDSALAYLGLVRLSAVPPSRRPSLAGGDRRVLIETIVLVDPYALTDDDRDGLVAAMRRGRERFAALRTAADVDALADAIRMGAARRTLLAWTLAHDPGRVPEFFSPLEALWAGATARSPGFDAWGVAAAARLGCSCVRVPAPRPLESFAGRWSSGVLGSGFADLNLRLAELLAELHMPGALLAAVLPAATADLAEQAVSRDHDDRRGLQEYAVALTRARVEEYLASLTAGGPLVPVAGAGMGPSGTGVWK